MPALLSSLSPEDLSTLKNIAFFVLLIVSAIVAHNKSLNKLRDNFERKVEAQNERIRQNERELKDLEVKLHGYSQMKVWFDKLVQKQLENAQIND